MAKKEEHHLHLALLLLIRSANDVGGLDIHSVNAASAASYAQTECKEASSAVHSGRTINVKKSAQRTGSFSDNISSAHRGDQRKQRGDNL